MANATKKEIVEVIARIGNTTKTNAEEQFDNVIQALEEVVLDDLKGLTLGKLGSFRFVDLDAREFRHPNDPTKVTVKPARQNLKFRTNKTSQGEIEERTAK